MSVCDICGSDAINFVSAPSYAWEGNPAFGSFRTFRCDEHTREAVLAFEHKGVATRVDRIRGADELMNALKASVRLGDLERRVRLLEEKSA